MDLTLAKHAFVTGGASGIGLGIADALLQRGIAVTIVDIDQGSLERTLAERAGRMNGEVLDVRDRVALAAVKARAEGLLGPVDILAANAGIGPDGDYLADANPESFEKIMAINVGGIFNCISAFARDMRERRRGHIVITGSMAGLATQQVARIGAYTASKFAVVALGETLRGEMAPYDVGVTILCPGMVASNLGRNTLRMGVSARPLKVDPRPTARPSPAEGMDPALVGQRTLEGIARNEAYVMTHPEDQPSVEARWRALAAAFSSA